MEAVESIGELVSALTQRIRTDNRVLWFRGHRCIEWTVQPFIQRGYDNTDERNFTHRFRSRARTRYPSAPEYDNLGAWLSLMQHFGLPTRLLDWTRSPLVALYFAVEAYTYNASMIPSDACIWILEPHRLNAIDVQIEYTPSIDSGMCKAMLSPAFDGTAEETGVVMAAMAAESDLRMFVQQGCFTIHSYRGSLSERENQTEYLSGFRIPAQRVRDLAKQLDVCGFRKGDIFPDLQNLADEFKGIFPPRS